MASEQFQRIQNLRDQLHTATEAVKKLVEENARMRIFIEAFTRDSFAADLAAASRYGSASAAMFCSGLPAAARKALGKVDDA